MHIQKIIKYKNKKNKKIKKKNFKISINHRHSLYTHVVPFYHNWKVKYWRENSS